MNFRATLWLTLSLFIMMLGAGVASGYVGYFMGSEALKAVTQPDINSEDRLPNKQPKGGTHKGLKIINEKDILVKVYNQIHSQKQNQSFTPKSQTQTQANLVDHDSESKQIDPTLFPIVDRVKGVTLEVFNAKFQRGSLLLGINLKNESSQPVRFLYSFLDVRDDEGRYISSISDGLPGDLPPNGQNFRGALRIPMALLENTRNISLTLTDYPEQNLKLKLPKIPVSR